MKKPAPKGHAKYEDLNNLFSELKSEYLESFPEKLQAIEKLWQARNVRAMEDEYHKIKGTGTTYGVAEVSEVAELLEALCYHGHPQLGLAVLLSLEIFQKICDLYVKNQSYELAKDPSFRAIRKIHAAMDAA